MKIKFFKSSILSKLIIIFLTAIMMICAIYLYFYSSSMNLLINERITAVDTAGKDYLQTLDLQIANIKRAIYNTYSLQDWSKLATCTGKVDDYEVLQQVIIAEERIRAIGTNSEIVTEVSVHFPKWGRTITTAGGLKDFNFEEWNNIKMPVDSVGAQIVYYEGQAYLTSKYQLANPELFSILVKISFEKFHHLFSTRAITATFGSTFLFDTKTGQLLLKKTDPAEDTDAILDKIAATDFSKAGYHAVNIGGNGYFLINNTSNYSNLRIVNAVKIQELTKLFEIQKQMVIIFLVVIFIVILLIFIYINRSLVNPINKMLQAFKPMEKGDFTVRLPVKTKDEFGVLFISFNNMVENINALVKEVYEKEILVERANFKQLQSQINPHFLYNSFYALSTMIKIGDEENAAVFCNYLAAYYQYITRSGVDTVPLDAELKHAENYLNIMAMRNSNIDLEFRNDLNESAKDIFVPRLIVQPIIENAFEHGLERAVARFSLKVLITQTEDKICITVEDNGKCNDEEINLLNAKLQEHQPVKETTGIFNIHKRLGLFFDGDSGILISRSCFGGFKVTMNISGRSALK